MYGLASPSRDDVGRSEAGHSRFLTGSESRPDIRYPIFFKASSCSDGSAVLTTLFGGPLIGQYPSHRPACTPTVVAMSSRDVAASLGKLNIDPKIKSRKEPVESWEDEADDSPSDENIAAVGKSTPPLASTSDSPAPPPPTPSSPSVVRSSQYSSHGPLSFDGALESVDTDLLRVNSPATASDKRPEKTTAVASRLIAAGLGQRAPRRTPEQREYDQAMKLQEKKKRDQAKAEEERKLREKEQAKKAIWED